MMKLMTIGKRVITKIKGPLKCAIEDGMVVEKGVTVMGGVDFGSEPYLITLRKNCRISFGVSFITHDGGTWAFRNSDERYRHVVKYGRIQIGEYSFIGAKSVILPNVTIGNHCVVAAGSVVTKSVADGTVVGGVPAKFICSTTEYAEKCLQMMPDDFNETEYLRNKKEYLIEHL